VVHYTEWKDAIYGASAAVADPAYEGAVVGWQNDGMGGLERSEFRLRERRAELEAVSVRTVYLYTCFGQTR
jgi:hypothetical protein